MICHQSGRAERWINPLALENRVEYDAQERAVRNIRNATASNPADMLVTEQLYSPDGALEIRSE